MFFKKKNKILSRIIQFFEIEERDFPEFLNKVKDKDQELYEFIRTRDIKEPTWKQEDYVRTQLEIIQKNSRISGYKSGYMHFKFDSIKQKGYVPKAYITVNPYSFKAQNFLDALNLLESSGFKGEIKIVTSQNVERFIKGTDNILIYSDTFEILKKGIDLFLKKVNILDIIVGEDLVIEKLGGYTYYYRISMKACNYLEENSRDIEDYKSFKKRVRLLFADNGPFIEYLEKNGLQIS